MLWVNAALAWGKSCPRYLQKLPRQSPTAAAVKGQEPTSSINRQADTRPFTLFANDS